MCMSSDATESLRQSARGYAQKTYDIGTAIRDIIESIGTGRVPVIQTSVLTHDDGTTYEVFNDVQFADVDADVYVAAGFPAIDHNVIADKQKSALQKVIALELVHRQEMYAILSQLGFNVEAIQ